MTPTGPGSPIDTRPPAAATPGVAAPAAPTPRLRELLREDLSRYVWSPGRRNTVLGALEPGFHAVAVHRYAAWTRTQTGVRRKLARWSYDLAYLAVRNVYGIELPETVQLGRRVRIAHQSGIVIHPNTVIGDDCVIRQNVSLGAARGDAARTQLQAPRLGRGVSLGAGAVVIGGVRIGDDAWVGPNAVVMTNVPAGATVLAAPPRILRLPSQVAQREEELRER